MAVTASVAHLFGAQKTREVGHFVRQALWMSQGFALFSFLIVRNADPILFWLEIDAEIIPITLGYVDAITWGLPALCAFVVLRYFSEGVSMTRPIVFIGLVGLVTNIFGNYVFMYGRLGVPAMGAVGCGWASALVMWMMFLCITAYVTLQRHYRPFGVFERLEGPQLDEIREILKLGLPIGVSVFLEASLFATVALLMGSMGTNVVAGHQIAINIASITFMIPLGLSMAITVRVGQSMGRGSQTGARRAGIRRCGPVPGVHGDRGSYHALAARTDRRHLHERSNSHRDRGRAIVHGGNLSVVRWFAGCRCRCSPRPEGHGHTDGDHLRRVLGYWPAPRLYAGDSEVDGATGNVDWTDRGPHCRGGVSERAFLLRDPEDVDRRSTGSRIPSSDRVGTECFDWLHSIGRSSACFGRSFGLNLDAP